MEERPKCPDCNKTMWPAGGWLGSTKDNYEYIWKCNCGGEIVDVSHKDGTLKIEQK